MSTKTSPGILALENKASILKTNDGANWVQLIPIRVLLNFFFNWPRNCVFILTGVRVSNSPKQTQEAAGLFRSQNYHMRQKFSKLLLLYWQCPSGELLTAVTRLNRHHIKNEFLSLHRQRKYIFPFQERASRRGAMIFLCILDQLLGSWKCCYTDSVGWILHKHM